MGSEARTLSVVIVSLDEGENLRRTVENLWPTLPANHELIIVDDGSTDGSSDFLAGDHRAKLLRTERLGIAQARNLGASESQGEVIVFSDAHVNVSKGWWEPLLRALEKPQAGAAGPAIADMEHPEFKGYGYCFQGPDLEMKWLPQKADTAYPVPQLGGCFIGMRRDVFKSIGGFDSGMIGWGLNDSELCMRLWGENYDLWVVPQVEVAHLFRERFPYQVEWPPVIHNALRLSLLHFEGERWASVIGHYREHSAFAAALALVVEHDVCARRREVASRRVRDAESLFRRYELDW